MSCPRPANRLLLAAAALLALLLTAGPLLADESPATTSESTVVEVTFRRGEQLLTVSGRVLGEDAEGGVLLEQDDAVRWVIEAGEVVSQRNTERAFKPLTHDQLAERLLADLPDGFAVHTTPHYIVCYNTSRAYAQWTSSLLERLHRAFTAYWQGKGAEITEPEFPLVVMVYATREQYQRASAEELGHPDTSIVGYYSLATNRVNMYDLTGSQAAGDSRRGSLKSINQMLARPEAGPLVATIVHEATHQIAFNCGLSQRLADLPLWMVEGMAVYFEAPDLTSRRGWQGIGKVNYPRLEAFRANLHSGARSSVLSLVAADDRMRNPRTAPAAYADAWALTYYLIRYHPDQYVAYVTSLSKQLPLEPRTPEERIAEFRRHIGDPAQIEQQMLKRLENLR